jgi:hypothetical protein
LRVATQTTGHDTATVGLFIDAGSRFETDESSGAANFVEHLVFKGTQNKTQAQIEAEFEKLGAEVGGYTARETTVRLFCMSFSRLCGTGLRTVWRRWRNLSSIFYMVCGFWRLIRAAFCFFFVNISYINA